MSGRVDTELTAASVLHPALVLVLAHLAGAVQHEALQQRGDRGESHHKPHLLTRTPETAGDIGTPPSHTGTGQALTNRAIFTIC